MAGALLYTKKGFVRQGMLAGKVHCWQSIYIYLGLGSYRLTIVERNGGVGCKGNSRVVEKSSSWVANMNSECFSDCESYLLEGVDGWCWGRVGMSVEVSCLCEFPIMAGKFEGAFWD